MKDLWLFKFLVLVAAFLALREALPAQEPGCLETSALGAMARANSPVALKARKQKAGDSYRAQLIFAARMLELDPNDKTAAESLLNLIPTSMDDPREKVWLELDELPQCPSGRVSDSDLKPLGQLQYRLPRLLARAVLLVPEKMFPYVSYALISVNPESDNAIQMRKVCRAKHQEFVNAIDKLSPRDRKWFVSDIFNPEGCRTIAFPEQ